MYEFFLVLFFLVSILLIVLIIFQPGGSSINIDHAVGGPEKLFKCSDRNYFFTYVTILLSFLFFLFSLCLCNINTNNIKLKNNKLKVNTILNEDNNIINTHYKK